MFLRLKEYVLCGSLEHCAGILEKDWRARAAQRDAQRTGNLVLFSEDFTGDTLWHVVAAVKRLDCIILFVCFVNKIASIRGKDWMIASSGWNQEEGAKPRSFGGCYVPFMNVSELLQHRDAMRRTPLDLVAGASGEQTGDEASLCRLYMRKVAGLNPPGWTSAVEEVIANEELAVKRLLAWEGQK